MNTFYSVFDTILRLEEYIDTKHLQLEDCVQLMHVNLKLCEIYCAIGNTSKQTEFLEKALKYAHASKSTKEEINEIRKRFKNLKSNELSVELLEQTKHGFF